MIKKTTPVESNIPEQVDLLWGMCRRGVSSPLAIVTSLLAAFIIFFSALPRIAEHGKKKKKKFKCNSFSTLHSLKRQYARLLGSDPMPIEADWQGCQAVRHCFLQGGQTPD